MNHQAERLVAISVVEPVDRKIGNDVGHITGDYLLFAHLDHRGVVVDPLPGKNVPVVETLRVALFAVSEVPFADHRCLVSSRF